MNITYFVSIYQLMNIWVVVNNTAVDTRVQVFVWGPVLSFLWDVSKSGIDESSEERPN